MTGIERLRSMAERHNFLEPEEARWDIADQIEREHTEELEEARAEADAKTAETELREAVTRRSFENIRLALKDGVNHIAEAAGIDPAELDELPIDEVCPRIEQYVKDMRRRLMPEGMEWPRFEDGEPVDFGDEVAGDAGDARGVDKVVFYGDQWRLFDRYGCEINEDMMGPGERVRRPAKVLDADGVEIRDGDTVWLADGRGPWSVSRIVYADRLRVICDDEKNGHLNVFPESITHRAPVLAADGKPLREGETVWFTTSGREICVDKIEHRPDGFYALELLADGSKLHSAPVSILTHERPVNHCFECSHWQVEPGRDRLGVCWDTYGERECEDSYAAVLGTSEACAQFERRAKALAERDA